ncbi:Gldg family protein [Paraglaciecola aquimarina]|uniref:Gldg family protein n=1 Tax=Paraglaciecola algarum TaxID=3050085 RepID=A0ABS9D574_9ALTE|nr:Gldg family protein [Paraglaciecola sp. G1-23]MCF2947824.1 Gldg family protein [Paraglaciecola sp. G1-23]
MQPNQAPNVIRRIASKEVTLFFASPVAYLFLASFVGVTLFTFFWGEAFFARNIADVRPLFEWMPILLIFLASALTMKLWSEERRSGTLEHLLTQPVPISRFVLGKFYACLILLLIALAITLPLPITVSLIGELDWGPVFAGYLATFLVGAVYLSIGLYVSAKSENQIVSLISACALCGVIYLVGSDTVTSLFASPAADWLRQLGTGSRFDAITRGVLDFRDLYYYLSIVGVFIFLNTYVLEKERWATRQKARHHFRWKATVALLIANILGANLWLGQLTALRTDVTEGQQYSISEATNGYLAQLQEPLVIKGYFSDKTHPLLAPLVPQIKDLIKEYEIAGKGKVRVEIINPISSPEAEKEANQKYGIQPVPFQVADRYESSIVNSYFNVVMQYADEHQVLGFRELIEVKSKAQGDIEVKLRNPEHDMTRGIKKVLNAYQAGGNLFDTVKGDLTFRAYVSSDDLLPEQLVQFKKTVDESLKTFVDQAQGRLNVEFIDPSSDVDLATQIATDYGFQPLATSLFSQDKFYFYLTLIKDEQIVQIPFADMQKSTFESNLEAGIKRFASGFTKSVALVAPASYGQYGGGKQFRQLEEFLGAELNVKSEDLSDGAVSGDADVLVLAAPESLDQKALFAVDQFLMQGGTVIASTSPFASNLSRSSLSLQQHTSGLEDWLAHHGVSISNKLVMDTQSTAFPIPITRSVGGLRVQEMRMIDYPYFVDIRGEALNQDNIITSNIPQVTMPWASPIELDKTKMIGRNTTELFKSSEQAWLTSSTDIVPKVTQLGVSAYTPAGEQSSHLLGVMSEGRFDSYFAGKTSPLLEDSNLEASNEDESASAQEATETDASPIITSVIERSPESSRLLVFSSNDLFEDQVTRMAGSASGSEYLHSMQLMANAVDYALADTGLLSIRARGHFNRTLPPMERDSQLFWEYLNYLLAALGIGVIAVIQTVRRRVKQKAYFQLLTGQ